MVYHKAEDKLLCHYCGAVLSPVPDVCPDCGGAMKYTGFGTQRVEEELAQLFPAARILRMDLDTTSRKNAHETMLRRFAAGEYDIMLGTQMVAKGLDFEQVTLVGVLGIDQMLFAQGYKAVSYTHLDVYKRQAHRWHTLRCRRRWKPALCARAK